MPVMTMREAGEPRMWQLISGTYDQIRASVRLVRRSAVRRLDRAVRVVVPVLPRTAAAADRPRAARVRRGAADDLRVSPQPVRARVGETPADVAVPGYCDSLGGAVARPELRRPVHALPASGAVARNSFHLLKIRVGPHIFWFAGAPPRRCCSAHSRLATAQGCHALPSLTLRILIRCIPAQPTTRRYRLKRESSSPCPMVAADPASPFCRNTIECCEGMSNFFPHVLHVTESSTRIM